MIVHNRASRPIRPTGALRQVKNGSFRIGKYVVLAASLFNLVLCFVSTKGALNVSSALIANISLLIVSIGATEAVKGIRRASVYISILAVLGCVVELRLLNEGLDLKIVFDLSICLVFFFLGRCSEAEDVRFTMNVIMLIVLIVELFEWLLPDLFQKLFNIWNYYVAKGALGSETVNYGDTTFAINGVRSADVGRTMLPWLFGVHRISSVFLEPVSMGNFAIICLMWSLCLEDVHKRIVYVCVSIFFIVLPDSRYALFTGSIILAIDAFKLDRYTVVLSWLPLLIAGLLYAWGATAITSGETPTVLSDDLFGRLQFSGKLLAFWTPLEWLALAPSTVYTADTGYAYLINNLGLPLSVIVFFGLRVAPSSTSSESKFRGMMYVYFSTSLCVGASFFSIKTAGLLWYLLGAMRDVADTSDCKEQRDLRVRSKQIAQTAA